MANLEEEDPFSGQNLAIQHFITSARIYDALLTLITISDAAVAKDLMELHMAGHLLGPAPALSGIFLTNDMNASTAENEETDDNE